MGFAPIGLDDYVKSFLRVNPGSDEAAVAARLRDALADLKAGARCECGKPIWVIGSAEAGLRCFTCITGEANPDHDCEIDEACPIHDAWQGVPAVGPRRRPPIAPASDRP